MPIKAKRPCKVCGRATHGAYCQRHKPKDRRASAARRGYGHSWRKLRAFVLRRSPLCADPHGIHKARGESVPAEEVHHVVALAAGGSNELENLEALCKPCHSRITLAEAREGGSNL